MGNTSVPPRYFAPEVFSTENKIGFCFCSGFTNASDMGGNAGVLAVCRNAKQFHLVWGALIFHRGMYIAYRASMITRAQQKSGKKYLWIDLSSHACMMLHCIRRQSNLN